MSAPRAKRSTKSSAGQAAPRNASKQSVAAVTAAGNPSGRPRLQTRKAALAQTDVDDDSRHAKRRRLHNAEDGGKSVPPSQSPEDESTSQARRDSGHTNEDSPGESGESSRRQTIIFASVKCSCSYCLSSVNSPDHPPCTHHTTRTHSFLTANRSVRLSRHRIKGEQDCDTYENFEKEV